MEIKVSCFEVRINEDEEHDYNWAILRINVPATDGPKGSLLFGEIEVMAHDINNLKRRQRDLYLDIDRRFKKLESDVAQLKAQ